MKGACCSGPSQWCLLLYSMWLGITLPMWLDQRILQSIVSALNNEELLYFKCPANNEYCTLFALEIGIRLPFSADYLAQTGKNAVGKNHFLTVHDWINSHHKIQRDENTALQMPRKGGMTHCSCMRNLRCIYQLYFRIDLRERVLNDVALAVNRWTKYCRFRRSAIGFLEVGLLCIFLWARLMQLLAVDWCTPYRFCPYLSRGISIVRNFLLS